MAPFTKTFLLLVLGQSVCLAVGMWLQERLATATATWGVERAGVAQAAPANPGGLQTKSGSEPRPSVGVRLSLAATAQAFLWTAAVQALVVYLILARIYHDSRHQKDQSAREALRRADELVRTRDAVIVGLAKLAEFRDPETGHHLERISLYSTRLAAALRRHPRYREVVTAAFVRQIGVSSALHDIGKVGVEDAILHKPGRLDAGERLQMQLHAALGSECIGEIERHLGTSNFLQMAKEIALFHHERWDGTGYPRGVAGEQIPLSARIVSIADVYDALASRRPYKEPFSHEECVRLIREGAGSQFDPELVRVFLQTESEFRDIATRLADPVRDGGENPPAADPASKLTPEQERRLLAILRPEERRKDEVTIPAASP
jgi:HD-GYP domain-containing protein (c-di-GMP phosphodiesterase class II)